MKNLYLLILLFCFQSVLSQNINISEGDVFDGEPYLAINPQNGQHIVIAWMGWVNLANRFQIKTKTSFDGGTTWSPTYLLPHTVAGYSSADPCVEFNHIGEVFISFIDFTGTTPPITGGVYLYKSSDGGLSWESPKEVINTNTDGTKWPIDRPWMAIDKSNSVTQGNIYISTFNLNRLEPPYNPYLSYSSDNGDSFTSKYIDTTGWLAGSINPLPICSPAVSSSGVLYISYPSYVLTQSLYTQSFVAISTDGGVNLTHKKIITDNPPAKLQDYSLAKKGPLLISNPANADHVVFLYLSAHTGDLDVYLTETLDGGDNWSSPLRVNDDPIMNNRMQDMIWADFDLDGDLIVSWRDRRNGLDSTYQASTEIWASFRHKDSLNFSPNFQLTSESIAHDTDLETAGNDFMCVRLHQDTLSAAWGDTRNGELNIWFQRMKTNGTLVSIDQISNEGVFPFNLYPNPTNSILHIKGQAIAKITLYDLQGKEVFQESYSTGVSEADIDLSGLSKGTYWVYLHTKTGKLTRKVIIQ